MLKRSDEYKKTCKELCSAEEYHMLEKAFFEREKTMEQFTGKVWKLGDDIDTDIIIPTEYLALKTIEDMKLYGFSPLRPELAAQIGMGDVIVAGKNFGCGSSREQAPEVIKALGIKCIVAKSFARIFFRNSINNGLLLIEQPDLYDDVEEGELRTFQARLSLKIKEGDKTWVRRL